MAYLEPGSTGPEVTELQQKLVEMGYFVGEIDGVFGLKTAAAVCYLQSCHGLDIDAVVGPQVKDLLDMDAGANMSVGVTAVWPDIDVWHPGDEFVVQLQSLGGAHAHVDVLVFDENDLVHVLIDDGVGVLARNADSHSIRDGIFQGERRAFLVDPALIILGRQGGFRTDDTH